MRVIQQITSGLEGENKGRSENKPVSRLWSKRVRGLSDSRHKEPLTRILRYCVGTLFVVYQTLNQYSSKRVEQSAINT